MRHRKLRHTHCPVEAALDLVGGKWKAVLLTRLETGTLRFGELRRSVPGITQRMLTRQLRELEADGIVSRKVYRQVPPRVDYALTARGTTLRPVLRALARWGKAHAPHYSPD